MVATKSDEAIRSEIERLESLRRQANVQLAAAAAELEEHKRKLHRLKVETEGWRNLAHQLWALTLWRLARLK